MTRKVRDMTYQDFSHPPSTARDTTSTAKELVIDMLRDAVAEREQARLYLVYHQRKLEYQVAKTMQPDFDQQSADVESLIYIELNQIKRYELRYEEYDRKINPLLEFLYLLENSLTPTSQ